LLYPPHGAPAHDRLVFAGVVESVAYLQKIRGLLPATNQVFKLDAPRAERCLIEAVVSDICPVVGRTVREGGFRTLYNAAIIAVARNGQRLRQKIGDIVLRPGDTLLLEVDPSLVDRLRNSRDFFLVSRVAGFALPRYERAPLALLILVAMIVVAGLGWLSMVNAAILAAGFMVLGRCCTPTAARQSVHWPVLMVVAASLGIGAAMKKTGAADAIGRLLVGAAGNSPWLTLAAVYAATMLFTEVMSHFTAVVVVFPIALSAAAALGVDHMPYVMAVMMAASCGFATPIGPPTNLMVFGPGNYRFRDFLRFGGALNLIIGGGDPARCSARLAVPVRRSVGSPRQSPRQGSVTGSTPASVSLAQPGLPRPGCVRLPGAMALRAPEVCSGSGRSACRSLGRPGE
jgi:hypothetical protein